MPDTRPLAHQAACPDTKPLARSLNVFSVPDTFSVRDLSTELVCGGLMSRLERTRVGTFGSGDAIPAGELTLASIQATLLPAVWIVQHLPQYDCTPEDIANLLCGRVLTIAEDRLRSDHALVADEQIALTAMDYRELLAIAIVIVTPDLRLQPRTVFIRPPSVPSSQ